MRTSALLLAIAILFGCDRSSTVGVPVGVEVGNASPLEFPPTLVEETSTQLLTLRNTGRVAVAVELRTEAPFGAPERLDLHEAQELAVPITFSPRDAGELTGTITVIWEGERVGVPVNGTGVLSFCSPPGPCHVSVWDPQTDACNGRAVPDGTQCSAPCLAAGTCLAGRCVGPLRNCSDGDPCTADACDSSGTCVHSPMRCPSPVDRCLAAACRPGVGCLAIPVLDGTPCGPLSCGEREVCIAGDCVVRPVPDGTECGVASPCQPTGKCRGDVCERPAPVALEPEWTRQTSIGARRPPIDLQGNLVYFEPGGPNQSYLLSLRPDGTEKYRIPAGGSLNALGVMGNRLIAADAPDDAGTTRRLHAFRVSNGTHEWTTDLSTVVSSLLGGDPNPASAYGVRTEGVFETASGRAGFVLQSWRDLNGKRTPAGGFVIEVEPETGTVPVVRTIDNPAHTAAIRDVHGNIYIRMGNLGGGWDTLSLDPSLNKRWFVSDAWPFAVHRDRVFAWSQRTLSGKVLDSTTGAVQHDVVFPRSDAAIPMAMVDGTVFHASLIWRSYYSDWANLDRFALHKGASIWSVSLGEGDTMLSPVLTASKTVLVASGTKVDDGFPPSIEFTLREFGFDGEERFACELAGPFAPGGSEPLLSGGRYLIFDNRDAGLLAFPVPDRHPAEEGWVSSAANPQRTHVERRSAPKK